MTAEQRALYVRGMLLQVEILMNGMAAENRRCEMLNLPPAYDEKDFVMLIDQFGINHNELMVEILGD